MHKRAVLLAAALASLVLAAAALMSGAATSALPVIPADTVVNQTGFGPIKLGDHLSTIRNRTRTEIDAPSEPTSCDEFAVRSIRGVFGILRKGRVRSVVLRRTRPLGKRRTSRGLTFAYTVAGARRLYGTPSRDQGAKYWPNGRDVHWRLGRYAGKNVYLRVTSSSPTKIEYIEVGFKPEIELVEGCL